MLLQKYNDKIQDQQAMFEYQSKFFLFFIGCTIHYINFTAGN